MPTLAVGIETFIVRTLVRSVLLFNKQILLVRKDDKDVTGIY